MYQDVIEAYNSTDEEYRLQSTKARRVEYLTTIDALKPYITDSTQMLDCGCGTGVYSLLFSTLCKKIVCVDLVPRHIERLNELSVGRNNIEAFVGNAVDLSHISSNSFDVVLCLGPLYHLVKRTDQDKCISECIRVAKYNGIIAFAYISPYSVFPCVLRGDSSRCTKSLANKIICNHVIDASDSCSFWTDNAYHTPDEIENLMNTHQLLIMDHLATDGQSIAFQETINNLDDDTFEIWINYHKMVCRSKNILGTSNHGLIIAKKQELSNTITNNSGSGEEPCR